jgi:hypothetical protein
VSYDHIDVAIDAWTVSHDLTLFRSFDGALVRVCSWATKTGVASRSRSARREALISRSCWL